MTLARIVPPGLVCGVAVAVVTVGCGMVGCGEAGPTASAAVELGVLEQSADIEGRDGGLSVHAWDRSIWTYGDTVLNVPDVQDRSWHHNSVSYTSDLDASEGITAFIEPLDGAGAPGYLIAPTPSEQAFNDAHWADGEGNCAEQPCGARYAVWPGQPVWDEANQRVLLLYSLIYAEVGDFAFEGAGYSIATWGALDEAPQRPVIDPDAEHPDLLWGADDPAWVMGGVILDGQLHAFACDGADGAAHDCRVARAPVDEIHDPDAWRYWDGKAWGADMRAAETLFPGAPILSVAYNDYLGEWLAIYSPSFSSQVVARTADSLTGPWSKEGLLYDAGDDEPYDAVAHPEYEEDGGRVQYISYSRHTSGWFGTQFPLVRVELD